MGSPLTPRVGEYVRVSYIIFAKVHFIMANQFGYVIYITVIILFDFVYWFISYFVGSYIDEKEFK